MNARLRKDTEALVNTKQLAMAAIEQKHQAKHDDVDEAAMAADLAAGGSLAAPHEPVCI
jgi:hypothetical protein